MLNLFKSKRIKQDALLIKIEQSRATFIKEVLISDSENQESTNIQEENVDLNYIAFRLKACLSSCYLKNRLNYLREKTSQGNKTSIAEGVGDLELRKELVFKSADNLIIINDIKSFLSLYDKQLLDEINFYIGFHICVENLSNEDWCAFQDTLVGQKLKFKIDELSYSPEETNKSPFIDSLKALIQYVKFIK